MLSKDVREPQHALQDAAGPVEGLDVPGNSNLEPLIAHPPVLGVYYTLWVKGWDADGAMYLQ